MDNISTGEPRPTLDWIPESAVIQRIRRKLARQGRTLRQSLDTFTVDGGEPVTLAELAQQTGVLASHERIWPNVERSWRHYIGRERVELVNGQRMYSIERLTRDYTTVKAARKAGAKIENREGLRLCGYDAGD